MTSTRAPEAVTDPALTAAVELARAAAREQAGADVGAHVGVRPEDAAAATHLFEADNPGYGGWRWAVTLASAGPGHEVTVSEVVLLPGPDALTAPQWVPWNERVRAGDLGVGDLLPTDPLDPRLVPGYVMSDDPAVEETAREVGLGRHRVLSRLGRLEAADRWRDSDFGPGSDMARGAPAHCGTCGFYLSVAGSLGAAFGVCGNEIAPADGRVVHAEYGCGAHSEAEVEQVSPVLVADLIYDDAVLDVEHTVPAPVSQDPEAAQDAGEDAAAEGMAEIAEVPAVDEAAPAESAVPVLVAPVALDLAAGESTTPAPEARIAESAAPVVTEPETADPASTEPETAEPVSTEAGTADQPAAEAEAAAESLVTWSAPELPEDAAAVDPVVPDDSETTQAVAAPAQGEAADEPSGQPGEHPADPAG